MRPSFSVSLEPGLERGVPWGRDLFTFVTSAAGHMMRTLQKPRKSRPSKRQVNHRRFLHNMIQRKFADIEAANHRLASALYVKDGENPPESLLLHSQETLEPAGPTSQRESLLDADQRVDVEGASKSRSDVSEVREPRQLDQRKPTSTDKMNDQSKMRQTRGKTRNKTVEFSLMNNLTDKDIVQETEPLQSESPSQQSQMKPMNDLPETNVRPSQHPDFLIFAQNTDDSPRFSPELSPLFLDSCDFSAQMLMDLSAGAQAQEATADGLIDQTELFSVGNRDSVGHMDVESYFESICPDNFTRLDEDERNFGYSCEEDRGEIVDYFQRNLRQSDYPETRQPGQSADRTSVGQHHGIPELQSCMLGNSLIFTPFEGVAQSFPVPAPQHERRPVPTPPHGDDWLFPDIQNDRQFPYC